VSTRDALLPAYLIYGSDRPKVELAVRRLRSRVEEEGGGVEALSATGDDAVAPGDVIDACNALGLFGGRRLVLVTAVDAWKDKASLPGLQAIAAYLEAPAPETVLALVGDAMKADAPVVKALGGGLRVLTYDLPERKELPGWLRKQAERAGLDIEPDALRRLQELGRDDALAMASELEKLALWADGKTVTAADVDALSVLDPDLPPWDLTDALGYRRERETMEMLGRFLDGRDGEVARILPALARHMRQLSAAKPMADQGAGADAVAKALGMRSAFPARKLIQQAALWSREELAFGVARMAQAERETRGDSPLPDRFSLERAVTEALAGAPS
jgi:DNA polymerase III subunit delta